MVVLFKYYKLGFRGYKNPSLKRPRRNPKIVTKCCGNGRCRCAAAGTAAAWGAAARGRFRRTRHRRERCIHKTPLRDATARDPAQLPLLWGVPQLHRIARIAVFTRFTI